MPPTSPLAVHLVRAATDPSALAILAEWETPGLQAWLTRVLRDADLAEEAVQEVWMGLLQGGWTFAQRTADGDGDARAWLRQVALRMAFKLRRHQLSRQRGSRAGTSPTVSPRDPLEILESKDLSEVVGVCLEQLPPVQR